MVDKTDVEPGGSGSGGAAFVLRTNPEPVIGLKDRTPLIEVEGIAPGFNLVIKDLPTEVILPALLRRTLTVPPNTAKDINKSQLLIDAWNAKKIKLFADGLPVLTYPPLAVIIPVPKTKGGGTGGTGGTGGGGPLTPTGVTPGTYHNVTITVGADGRVTFAADGVPTPITLAGDVNGPSNANVLSATGVVPGIYTNATISVDAKGRITVAASGTGGGGSVIIWDEIPAGVIDGANNNFILSTTPLSNQTVLLSLNGVVQQPGAGKDYTTSGTAIVMQAGATPQVGDMLLATYQTSGPTTITWNEVPTGAIDGLNTAFALLFAPTSGTFLLVSLNGMIQKQGVGFDYTVSGLTVNFEVLATPQIGDVVLVTYQHS